MTNPWVATVANMMNRLPTPDGNRYATAIVHGSLKVLIYAPRQNDPQQPHEQDEVYVVAKGNGQFVRGSDQISFEEGDVLFVPAGMEHRFEDFSDDLVVWVVFYGPKGGEQPSP
ncbi:MAG: cupin domain-containing protein [Phycisphaerales bacterium]|nr:cupin domain-containing protein [Phycisphaerales bacterium]